MDYFLETKYRRRIFFGSAIITLIALVSLRFFIIPYLTGVAIPPLATILYSVIDSLFVALVASITIALLVIWVTPPAAKKASIQLVEPGQIRETLAEALQNTDEWWFKGAVGRHFRAVTLPKMAESARKESFTKKLFVLILDPLKAERFVELRRSRLSQVSKDKPWTVELLRKELNATVISAYATKASEPSLEITVGVVDSLAAIRIDLSSKLALLSSEGKQDFALRCDADTILYNNLREELTLSLQQARILPADVKGIPFSKLDVDNVKGLLQQLGLGGQDLVDDRIRDIIALVKKVQNPYE